MDMDTLTEDTMITIMDTRTMSLLRLNILDRRTRTSIMDTLTRITIIITMKNTMTMDTMNITKDQRRLRIVSINDKIIMKITKSSLL